MGFPRYSVGGSKIRIPRKQPRIHSLHLSPKRHRGQSVFVHQIARSRRAPPKSHMAAIPLLEIIFSARVCCSHISGSAFPVGGYFPYGAICTYKNVQSPWFGSTERAEVHSLRHEPTIALIIAA